MNNNAPPIPPTPIVIVQPKIKNTPLSQSNLALIQDTVKRFNQEIKANKGFRSLVFSPKTLYPLANPDNHIVFKINNKAEVGLSDNFAARPQLSDENANFVTPAIVFDLNIEKNDLLHILAIAFVSYVKEHLLNIDHENALKFKKLPVSEQNDEILKKSYLSTEKQLQDNLNKVLKNGSYVLYSSDDNMLMNFLIGHELSHLSFKERSDIQFKYMDKAILPDKSLQNYLNDALMNINALSNNKEQYLGANYKSTRDETHADVSGLYTMAYFALKYHDRTEKDIYRICNEIRKIRENLNFYTSVHAFGSHNSGLLFTPEYIKRIINIAKDNIQNPNDNVYEKILDVSEDVFFDTIKKDGIIFKQKKQVDSNFVKLMNKIHLNSELAYQQMVENNGKNGGSNFDKCFNSFSGEAVRAFCTSKLNATQNLILDNNLDNKLDYTNYITALKDSVKKNLFPNVVFTNNVSELEKQIYQKEAKVLVDFAEKNHISIRMTNELDSDIIELKHDGFTFKFKE